MCGRDGARNGRRALLAALPRAQMNQITNQVWVLDGGNLTQYNIW